MRALGKTPLAMLFLNTQSVVLMFSSANDAYKRVEHLNYDTGLA